MALKCASRIEGLTGMIGKGYRVLYNGFDVLMLAAGVRSFATWN